MDEIGEFIYFLFLYHLSCVREEGYAIQSSYDKEGRESISSWTLVLAARISKESDKSTEERRTCRARLRVKKLNLTQHLLYTSFSSPIPPPTH